LNAISTKRASFRQVIITWWRRLGKSRTYKSIIFQLLLVMMLLYLARIYKTRVVSTGATIGTGVSRDFVGVSHGGQ
jgi:hypothetical protein